MPQYMPPAPTKLKAIPGHEPQLQCVRDVFALMHCLYTVWQDDLSVPIGMILLEVHHTRNPWVTVRYVQGRLISSSVDTVRRRLEVLVDRGLAEFIENDGRRIYRVTDKAAEASMRCIGEMCV